MQIIKKRVIKVADNQTFHFNDNIVNEAPLTININGRRGYLCMRLPGADRELAAGILYSEGIISSLEDIIDIKNSESTVEIEIKGEFSSEVKSIYSSTGGMSSTDLITPSFNSADVSLTIEELFMIKDDFISNQKFFNLTGATHCAAIYDNRYNVIALAEDVGRHNALDKCTGSALLKGKLHEAAIVILSSRLSLEMIKKSYRAGASVIAAVSAPTSAAVDAAEIAGLTLIGFFRDRRFNIYSNPQRIKDITG